MSSPVLYPPIFPFQSGYLKVSDLHHLYYEQSGNPTGKAILFVHGGPGGGTEAWHRQFFDPAVYRIVLFDQRGAGQSKPAAELVDNTTPHLIDDIERLRSHLQIDRWVVFGGSWGSTLSLAYAQAHPDRVKGLILRGIFLCRSSEIRWFYQEGADQIYPDLWEQYLAPIPEEERHDLVAAYYRRLTSEDPMIRLEAARAWSLWEGGTSRLITDPATLNRFVEPEFALPFARIECHYFFHDSFLEPDQLLKRVYRIRHIPAVIVQGRYDIVCPMRSAWDLHRAWPEATLHIIPDAGHGAGEAGTLARLRSAADDFRSL